ncbi:MAG: AAA family ATPase [Chloroflexota bacterium]
MMHPRAFEMLAPEEQAALSADAVAWRAGLQASVERAGARDPEDYLASLEAMNEPTETRMAGLNLASVTARAIDWLWPGYVPRGKVTILDGDPGLGKSTVLIDLASRASIGGQTPTGEPLGPFSTIYATAEDDPADTILPRVLKAGGDPSRFTIVRKMSLPDDVHRLGRLIRRERAELLIVDPLVAYLADGVRTNVDHNVRRALEPLAAMAAEVSCSVIAIRHLNKRPGDDAIYRGGGSIGFTGLARSVLAVGRDPDDADRVILAAVKLNVARRPASLAYRIVADGPYAPAGIGWEGTSDHSAEDLIGRTRDVAGDTSKKHKLADAIAAVLDANGGSMPARDVYRALEAEGWDLSVKGTVYNARDLAGVRAVKGNFDGGWTWTL